MKSQTERSFLRLLQLLQAGRMFPGSVRPPSETGRMWSQVTPGRKRGSRRKALRTSPSRMAAPSGGMTPMPRRASPPELPPQPESHIGRVAMPRVLCRRPRNQLQLPRLPLAEATDARAPIAPRYVDPEHGDLPPFATAAAMLQAGCLALKVILQGYPESLGGRFVVPVLVAQNASNGVFAAALYSG
jgi:hypothetical protein